MASKQPTERKDPPVKPLDGTASLFTLQNKNPEHDYVIVFKGSQTALARYAMLGYQPVVYAGAGTPCPVGLHKFRDGQEVEVADHVLMWIEKSVLEEHRAAARKQADLITERIHGKNRGGSFDGPRELAVPQHYEVVPHKAD